MSALTLDLAATFTHQRRLRVWGNAALDELLVSLYPAPQLAPNMIAFASAPIGRCRVKRNASGDFYALWLGTCAFDLNETEAHMVASIFQLRIVEK